MRGTHAGEIAVLNRLGQEAGTWRQLFGVEFPAPTPNGALIRERTIPASFAAAAAVLAAFIALTIVLPRPSEIVPPRASFVDFPMSFGSWSGRRDALEGVYIDALQLDDYLLANYRDSEGPIVNLYVAYYNSQRKGEAVHSPRSCLPGGGWQMRDFDQRTLSGVEINGKPLRVNRTLIELGDQRQLVYYWFEQRGRIITNEVAVKWYIFWDAVTRHRTDGALVRLITPLAPTGNIGDADRELTTMAAHIAPIMGRFVPN